MYSKFGKDQSKTAFAVLSHAVEIMSATVTLIIALPCYTDVKQTIGSVFFVFQVAQYADLEVILALLCAICGFFGLALYPVCLELSVECSFPVGEGTAAGFLVLSGFVVHRVCGKKEINTFIYIS